MKYFVIVLGLFFTGCFSYVQKDGVVVVTMHSGTIPVYTSDITFVHEDSLRMSDEEWNRINADRKTDSERRDPNPFGPTTDLSFRISEPDSVCIRLYDVNRYMIARLFQGRLDPGEYRLSITPTLESDLPSGAYFYRMDIGDKSVIRRTIIIH
jgi:hypothetical protein